MTVRKLLAVVVSATCLALFAPVGTPAQAATRHWYGKVTRVVDGDTVMVDIDGDGRGAVPIRNAALQTTELNRSSHHPECHSVTAYFRMRQLLPVGARVRLSAYRYASTSGLDAYGQTRYVRYIDARDARTGQYTVDVQRVLIREGHGVWKPEPVESAREAYYHLVMQVAMREHRNIWNDHTCGIGPEQGARLRMWINYEADGVDSHNLNGEYVRIMNAGPTRVSLAGWKLRNPSQIVGRTYYGRPLYYYTFPSGTALLPGHWLNVYPTRGISGGYRYHLNEPLLPYFPNVSNPRRGYPGKSMFLLDPRLDFRATATYPCLVACYGPRVHIANVSPRGAVEYVDLRVNSGVTTPQDVTGVVVGNDGWVKELRPGTRLLPGRTFRVYCQGRGTDSATRAFWHHRGSMLEDGGDTVILRTATATVLSTYRYGTG